MWPDAVERVAAFLRTSGAEARLEEFPQGTPTAADAARACGCELSQIVKSLVVVCDDRPVVALIPGDRKADTAKVAKAVGASAARIASREEVETATGFEVGGVAPFPLRGVDRVLVERTLLAHEQVWIGAGSPRHMAGLAPAELVRLARAEAIDAVAEG